MALHLFLAVEVDRAGVAGSRDRQAHNEGVGIMRFLKIGVLGCLAAAAACSSNSASLATVPIIDAAIEDAAIVIPEDTGAPPHDTGAPEAAPAEAAPTGSTFTEVYTDIISPICVQCHNPQGIGVSSGHLDMSTKAVAFADLVGVAAMGSACGGMGTRVVAGSASKSILFEKVDPGTPAPCGSKMPLGLNPLTTAQAGEIESWINAGAMNN
jgi:hypothetical protein